MKNDPRCPEMIWKRPAKRQKTVQTVPHGQLLLRLAKPPSMTAEGVVRKHMLSILPVLVPPSFTSINDAEFRGTGRRRTAVARLTMFDGLDATVEVFAWGQGAAGHRWLAWDGGDTSFEDGLWVRVPAEACL
jgi:hypothetical protein